MLFTLNCHPAATRWAPEGPKNWEQSARSIYGFCTRVLRAGFSPTLFLTPLCAQQHAPLIEELAESGTELGLYVQPQSLSNGSYKRYLGQYPRDEQRAIVERAVRDFQDALGERPQSVRSAMFSASDDTYSVLHELGFRQGSLSSPGRRVAKHGAVWTDAPTDPHYVDRSSRLRRGDLPFLEIPVTTDSTQVRGGLSPDLAIENGTLEAWHRPLIEGQLQRMETEHVAFRTLCFFTRNSFDYHFEERFSEALDSLLTYLSALEEQYDVRSATLAAAHASFREMLS